MRLYVLLAFLPLFLTIHAGEGNPEAPTVPPGQTRTDKAKAGGRMGWWGTRDDRAEVLTASFLGGKGNEWLVDGGFLADGSLILVGNGIGGDFDLGVPTKVLGADGPKPAVYEPKQRMEKKDRQSKTLTPVLDQTGQPRYESVKWTDAGVTGFIVKLDPSCKRIVAAARLGWGSGAVTACEVAPDGSIYLAGRAEDGAARLSSNSDVQSATIDQVKGAPCQKTFVARVATDLSGIDWVRVVNGPAYAPRLTLRQDGSLAASLADLRTFSTAGKLVGEPIMVPGGLGDKNSVSPVDGEIVYGSEHNSPTGREPWRCPVLNIKHPDGSLRYQLLDWTGPFVGLENCRQVSDTAVRRVSHDAKGNINIILWSDGGNSIAHQQPTDYRRSVGSGGCGLTTAGANATSFAYMMRIEPENYQVIGWTLWCSQYGGKANGAGIDTTGEADDGSTCFAGGTAWGLRQTPNRLGDTEPGGSYIAVLTPDLTGVRFSSIIAGTGMAEVRDNCSWGIATGAPGGQNRAVFLCGAGKDGDNYGLVTPTPTKDAMQGTFGGGISDGWFCVLDLSKPTPEAKVPTTGGGRMTYRRAAQQVGKKSKDAVDLPDGTVFAFDPANPKYVTTDAEFRHPDPVHFWPNFFCGKPVSGSITWNKDRPTGSFVISCDRLTQPRGEQDRRVLGELIKPDAPPKLTLTVKSLGAMQEETFETTDNKGRNQQSVVQFCDGEAVLEIAGRTVNLKPRFTLSPGSIREKGIKVLKVSVWFSLKGSDLGMTGRMKDEEFDVRISCQPTQQGDGK